MSQEVAVTELATVLDRFAFAYLATIAEQRRTHIVAVRPVLVGNTFRIAEPGRTTCRNLGQQPAVTLVWPPSDAEHYSLIVDGIGRLDGHDLIVAPTRAVLHRPAPAAPTDTPTACRSDCIELPVAKDG